MRRSPHALALVTAVLLVGACSSSEGHLKATSTTSATTSSTATTAPGTSAASSTTASTAASATTTVVTAAPAPSSTTGSTAAPVVSSDWATYHGDGAHDGVSASGPSGAGAPHTVWTARVDGAIYGQPVAADGMVVVATEHDVVAGIDEATGAVRWTRTVGTPVDGSSLPCGDIDPSGVTSTPVIDPAARVVYVAAFVSPAHHQLFALDLGSGAIKASATVDPPGLSPTVEQQRGALVLANGRVYVPYGGLYGDCGQYKGAVVSVLAGSLTQTQSWITTAKREAGLWAVPGPTVAGDGSLYVSTGNAGSSGAYDGGDAVVHLSADLRQLDLFAPSNWQQLASSDADLGSTSPALIGSTVVQVGKTGTAYILNAGHLGGVGGQQSSVSACNSAFGGDATDPSTGTVYLPCRDGVTALRGGKVLWHGPSFNAGGPVVVGGSVWVPDLGAGDVVALLPSTGAARQRVHVGTFAHFATLGLGGGHLLAATMDGTVIALG